MYTYYRETEDKKTGVYNTNVVSYSTRFSTMDGGLSYMLIVSEGRITLEANLNTIALNA